MNQLINSARKATKFGSESDRDSEPSAPPTPCKAAGQTQPTAGLHAPAQPAPLDPVISQAGRHWSTASPSDQSARGRGPRRHRLLQTLAAPPGSAQQVRPERWPELVTWPRPATQGPEGQPRARLRAPPPSKAARPSVSPGLSRPRSRYGDPTRHGDRADGSPRPASRAAIFSEIGCALGHLQNGRWTQKAFQRPERDRHVATSEARLRPGWTLLSPHLSACPPHALNQEYA